MKNKKFIIFSPSYFENSGGIVVLHKLSHILNQLGYDAKIYPYFKTIEINKLNFFKSNVRFLSGYLKSFFKKYKVNKAFNTPVIKKLSNIDLENYIVIYPEIVFGNPLNAPNVVRWLLHQPGFHSGKIFYGRGEVYYKFNSAINDFIYPGSITSDTELKVIHYPLEYYYPPKELHHKRKGTAYCVRKGKSKKIVHDLDDSILIDGKSHEEVGEILRNVESFISYDVYTAYSIFAVLCGAKSIVVPDENVSVDDWYPNESDRFGIAYGFSNDQKKWADDTSSFVLEHIMKEEAKSINNVKNFALEVQDFFCNNKNKN